MALKSKTFLKFNKGRAEKVETGFYNNRKELNELKKSMKSKGYV